MVFCCHLWVNENGGTCKMKEIIFLILIMWNCLWDFFLSCLMKNFLHQLSGSTFIFVKNTHKEAANFMFRLILPTGMGSIQSCFKKKSLSSPFGNASGKKVLVLLSISVEWFLSPVCEIFSLQKWPEQLLTLVGLGCQNYVKAWGGADLPYH